MSKVFNWSFGIDSKDSDCNSKKGQMFENLIEVLLTCHPMFKKTGYQWKRTTNQTHDGKRDFELQNNDNNIVAWGECKNYSSPLSIDTLAPTLIMSVIENINEIYIFSLNSLNRTFPTYIKKFSNVTNKKILLFADDFLEYIIALNVQELLTYASKYSREEICDFLKQFTLEKINGSVKEGKIEFSEKLISFEGKEIDSDYKLSNNERFYYTLEVQNLSLNSATLTFSIPQKISDFFIVNKSQETKSICLKSGEIFVFKVCLQIIIKDRKTNMLNLPNFQCNCFFQKPSESYFLKLNPLKIKIVESSYTPLLGKHWEYKNEILKKLKSKEKIVLKGISGSGKSRLLAEISSDLMTENIQVIYFDLENETLSQPIILKKILLNLINIPDKLENNNLFKLIERKKDPNLYIVQVILNLDEEKMKESQYLILNVFNNFLSKTGSIFLIDNMQNCSEMLFNILLNIKCGTVFSFNTDYLYLQRKNTFQNIAHNSGFENFFSKQKNFTLPLFNKNLIKHYFKESLDFYSLDWLNEIIPEDFTCTPFYLKHLLIYMEEENIIYKTNGKYQIRENFLFESNFFEIFIHSEENILKKRFANIIKRYPNSVSLFTILALTGNISNSFFVKNDTMIKDLIMLNFIIEDKEKETLKYTHQKLQNYFLNKCVDCLRLNESLEMLKCKNAILSIEGFVCAFYEDLSKNQDKTTLLNLLDYFFDNKPYYNCNETILKILPQTMKNVINFLSSKESLCFEYLNKILVFYKWLIFQTQSSFGFGASLEFYGDIYDFILKSYIPFYFTENDNQLAYDIVREYFNCLIEQKQFPELKNESDRLLDIFKNFAKNETLYFWLSMIHNRRSIAFDKEENPNTSDYNNAIKEYDLADKYAKKSKNIVPMWQVEIDKGYHYYNIYTIYDPSKVIDHFQKSIMLRNATFHCSNEYHKVLIAFLQKEYQAAHSMVCSTLSKDRKLIYDYYFNKLLLTKVYLNIFLYNRKENNITKEIINNDLNTAKESIFETNFKNKFHAIYFLKGYYEEKFGDKQVAIHNYTYSLKVFCMQSQNINYKNTQLPFYYSIISKLYFLGYKSWNEIKKYDEIIENIVNAFKNSANKEIFFQSCPKGIIFDEMDGTTFPSL